MSSPEDRRTKVLPKPPLSTNNKQPAAAASTSISSTSTTPVTTPRTVNKTLRKTPTPSRASPSYNQVANRWKELEDNNNTNNTNSATLGVPMTNFNGNGLKTIKSRSNKDTAWITTTTTTTAANGVGSSRVKKEGEEMALGEIDKVSTTSSNRSRRDSFNSSSSRDSSVRPTSTTHSLRPSRSTSDNFAALRAHFHSPSPETALNYPSSPTRSSPRQRPPNSPKTRIPRPSSTRIPSAKSSPSIASMTFESRLTYPPIPRKKSTSTLGGSSIVSNGKGGKNFKSRELSSGDDATADGVELPTRSSSRGSVELSELVGDVFGAIDWNSRRTGTPNKLDARSTPYSASSSDNKTPRKPTIQGNGLPHRNNSNKPALMEAFMGPSSSWDSRSLNIRPREERSEELPRKPQASTSTAPPRPVRRSLEALKASPKMNLADSPSSRRLQDARSLSVSTSNLQDDKDRRPSMASSTTSITSSAASIIYRGSAQAFDQSDLESASDTFSQDGSLRERDLRDHNNQAAEKRTRLALFLDETAAAMEGGKSLSMVLPVPPASNSSDEGMSLSQLAEASPRPISGQYKSTFVSYRESPSPSPSLTPSSSSNTPSLGSIRILPPAPDSPPLLPVSVPVQSLLSIISTTDSLTHSNNGSPAPTIGTPNSTTSSNRPADRRRKTLYFTPATTVIPSNSPVESIDENGLGDVNEKSRGRYSPVVEEGDFGLGFNIDITMGRRPLSTSSINGSLLVPTAGTSPATVRGVSPMSFGTIEAAREVSIQTTQESPEAEEKRLEERKEAAKMAEKRRRTIHELLETEASYASDMVVVRDIYLARAKGTDMSAIADHVMSTGLGLGKPLSASPLSSPIISPTGSFSGALPPMMRRISSSLPVLEKGEPLMSKNDLHIVFANLEEIADLAEAFSAVLDAAGEPGEGMDDRIGEVFVEMLPRIQQVFSTYCARHHRAILKLQDLEPSLRTFLGECKTLSHGRTNAWDLASLLIKPVQRCLKYPLLLDQILAATPKDHPDRADLKRANTDMLMVAEHINEFKKRHDSTGRIVSKKEGTSRTPPPSSRTSSAGSLTSGSFLSRSVTKKFMRSSNKSKKDNGLAEQEKDEMFDTLQLLVENTKNHVLKFSTEMREWSRTTKTALEAQAVMVEGWIELYAPSAGEAPMAGSGHERLCVFLETVLKPVIEGPWRILDQEVKHALLTKTEHLLSLFENPQTVINKRNDRASDHSRYLAKKSSDARRGSEDFTLLSSQLLEELPLFLGSVSRYFNIIIAHFSAAQAEYLKTVTLKWTTFAEQWTIPVPTFESVQASFSSQQLPVAQMMETLAAGLGITASPAVVPRNRTVSTPQPSSSNVAPQRVPRQRFSSAPGTAADHNGSTTNRSSMASDSTPSFTLSSAGGSSSGTPTTPPIPSSSSYRTSKLFDHPDRRSSYTNDSGSFRTSMYGTSSFTLPTSVEDPVSRSSSHYLETGDRFDESYSYSRSGPSSASSTTATSREPFLYTAVAMASSRPTTATRNGQKILSLGIGDLLEVEVEEADSEEGGAGWLYGKTMLGERGWVRTEDFHLEG